MPSLGSRRESWAARDRKREPLLFLAELWRHTILTLGGVAVGVIGVFETIAHQDTISGTVALIAAEITILIAAYKTWETARFKSKRVESRINDTMTLVAIVVVASVTIFTWNHILDTTAYDKLDLVCARGTVNTADDDYFGGTDGSTLVLERYTTGLNAVGYSNDSFGNCTLTNHGDDPLYQVKIKFAYNTGYSWGGGNMKLGYQTLTFPIIGEKGGKRVVRFVNNLSSGFNITATTTCTLIVGHRTRPCSFPDTWASASPEGLENPVMLLPSSGHMVRL